MLFSTRFQGDRAVWNLLARAVCCHTRPTFYSSDVLDWLAEYPKIVKNHFVKGMRAYVDGHYRNSADEMRLSFEALLKSVLGNKKALEKKKTH